MKRIIYFSLFLIISNCSNAQNNWHLFDTTNSGLISNRINSVLIDKNNNVWCAYNGVGGYGIGVVKYNRTNWTLYNSTNSGLMNNDVRSMACDTLGNIWFSCYYAGIVKFDGVNWTQYDSTNSGILSNNVTAIKVDRFNNLWLACHSYGISKFNGTTWTNYDTTNFPLPTSFCVTDFAFDTEDNVWVGFECGDGLAKLNTTTNQWTKFLTSNSNIPHDYIGSLAVDYDDFLWIGFSYNGYMISRFDGTNWQTYYPFPYIYSGVGYRSFAVDSLNNIWCSAPGDGLWIYSGINWAQIGYPLPNNGLGGFSQSVAIDRNNNVWWVEDMNGLWTNDTTATAGINKQNMDFKDIFIYPNPAIDNIVIDDIGINNVKMQVYNMIGACVLQKELNRDKNEIDISSISKGMYIIALSWKDMTIRRKLIKE